MQTPVFAVVLAALAGFVVAAPATQAERAVNQSGIISYNATESLG